MTHWLALSLLGCGAPEAPQPGAPEPAPAPEGPSLYEIDLPLTGADGLPTRLSVHRGHPTLLSMFYASCHSACPMLVQNVRAFESSLPQAQREELRVLLVSLDPERDTPAALAEAQSRYGADPERWVLAIPPADRTRELAAVMGIQYRPGADGEIHHTSVLLLLDAEGRELARTSGPDSSTEPIREALARALGDSRDI